MLPGTSGNDLYAETMTLRYKVASLEEQIQKQAEHLKEAKLIIQRLKREIIRLSNSLKETLDQDEDYNIKWPWITKVVFILRKVGLPLRAVDILNELQKLDHTLSEKPNPTTYLSLVLNQGVRRRRIVRHKVKSFVGDFYALPEWSLKS